MYTSCHVKMWKNAMIPCSVVWKPGNSGQKAETEEDSFYYGIHVNI